jgi:hypothetical protein
MLSAGGDNIPFPYKDDAHVGSDAAAQVEHVEPF